MKFSIALVLALSLASNVVAQESGPAANERPAPTSRFQKIDNPRLPNAYRLTDKVISGGQPESDQADGQDESGRLDGRVDRDALGGQVGHARADGSLHRCTDSSDDRITHHWFLS